MAHRLCQFSTLPSIILNSEGVILQYNRAFAVYWNADPSKLLGEDGYNIFRDPFFRRKERLAALQKAFHGTPAKLNAPEYEFPAPFRVGGGEEREARLAAIFIIPFISEQNLSAVAVYYQTEASVLLDGETGDPCEKVAALTLALNDLRHEISNPLLLIIGHAQLLLAKSERLPPEAVRKLEKILNNAEKIRALLQERHEFAELLQASHELTHLEST